MTVFDAIDQPTLLLNSAAAKRNIRRMAQKAREQGVRFRPHFKTHQSAQIGEWFRAEGVEAITVSSVEMAEYFADAGWTDILIAFSANWHQTARMNRLAQRVRLGLLVESLETAQTLAGQLSAAADAWIKVDVGAARTGVPWQDAAQVGQIAAQLRNAGGALRLRGLLTHAGHTYAASGMDAVRVYHEGVTHLAAVRDALAAQGLGGLALSVGDTPGCTLSPDLGAVDEIRPGNFVFFDAKQMSAGVCPPQEVAAALACPVVAVHPLRGQVVVYGGAIHLSKDSFPLNGRAVYGLPALPQGDGWGEPLAGGFVASLSQEHGVVTLAAEDLARVRVGDWLCILPAHSCLTVHAMRRYLTLDGEWISTCN